MKFTCPNCKRVTKEFTPTENELKLFDDEEIEAGQAVQVHPCGTCKRGAIIGRLNAGT